MALVVALVITTAWADSGTDIARENAELKKRVERLEKELAELKKIVMGQQSQPVRTKAKPAPKARAGKKPVAAPQLSEADAQKLMALLDRAEANKKPVWSNLDIQLYGYIKADASYDTSRTTTGNYVVWVDRENAKDNDNEFNLTANQTRLGMKITGPQEDGMIASGRAEIDFYGGGAENKAKIQMRHAYLKLDWPDERFNIIAGQTSDVISPLNPSTLNYTVLWDGGNIGYRRPQIRLTKGFAISRDVDLTLEGAIARSIGDDETSSVAGQKSGEDSGFPTFQGRASLTFPWFGYKPTTIGVSGHWGEEEYDNTSATTSDEEFDSWSFNIDMTQPINEWLTIKGEYFTGENLDTYFGGIGQGVRTDGATPTTYLEKISSTGGWFAAGLGPWGKYRFNVGMGIDNVDRNDVNAGQRTLNRAIFGNIIYSINKNTEVGFELSHWRTRYKSDGDADDLRAQTSFIYKF